MKVGYARVSTITQNLDSQIDALKKAGCEKIITEQASGSVIPPLIMEVKSREIKQPKLIYALAVYHQ